MAHQFPESDWKLFRQLQPLALDRFCQRVLAEVGRLVAATGKGSHERYRAVFKLLQKRDEELAYSFDNPRRSTAMIQLLRIRAERLLTEDEFDRFSAETRAVVQGILDIGRT